MVLLAVGSNRPQPHGFHPNLLPAQGGPGERRAERQQLCGGVAVRAAWSTLAVGRAVPMADVQLRATAIPIWGLGPDAGSCSSASRRAAGDVGPAGMAAFCRQTGTLLTDFSQPKAGTTAGLWPTSTQPTKGPRSSSRSAHNAGRDQGSVERAEHTAAAVPRPGEHKAQSRSSTGGALSPRTPGRAGRWPRCASGRSPRRRDGAARKALAGGPCLALGELLRVGGAQQGGTAGLGAFLRAARGFCLVRETRSGAKQVLTEGFGFLAPALSSVSRAGLWPFARRCHLHCRHCCCTHPPQPRSPPPLLSSPAPRSHLTA